MLALKLGIRNVRSSMIRSRMFCAVNEPAEAGLELVQMDTGFSGQKPIGDFEMSEQMTRNLQKVDITSLFPVQVSSYDVMMNGKDIMGRSKTGSGKTLAFALPIVEKLLNESNVLRNERLRAMVLLPTRELAVQVANEFQRIGPQLRIATVVGGVSYTVQENLLARGVDVVVGTPGRLIDLMNKGTLDLQSVKFMVIDEADMMMKIGFKDAVEQLFEGLPEERQNVLWSATFPSWVNKVASKYLNKPEWIDLVGDDAMTIPSTVQHRAIMLQNRNRRSILSSILQEYKTDGQSLVFTQTKRECDELSSLETAKCKVLHGDLSQAQRTETINGFRQEKYQSLICTDIAARGLDISNVDLVIHYRLPTDRESFVHRTGRTGRAGRAGKNIVLFDNQDIREMKEIEKEFGIAFTHSAAPDPESLVKAIVGQTIDSIDNVPRYTAKAFEDAATNALEGKDPAQVLSAALALASGYKSNLPSYFSLLSGNENFRTLSFKDTSSREIKQSFEKLGERFVLEDRNIHSVKQDAFLVDIPAHICLKIGEDVLRESLNAEFPTELPTLFNGVRMNYRSGQYGNMGGRGFYGRSDGGGYQGRREGGGYQGRREGGGYQGRREGGGYQGRREGGGYQGRREGGGYQGRRDAGGYQGRSDGGGYQGRREGGGYQGRREGGFRDRREDDEFSGRKRGGSKKIDHTEDFPTMDW